MSGIEFGVRATEFGEVLALPDQRPYIADAGDVVLTLEGSSVVVGHRDAYRIALAIMKMARVAKKEARTTHKETQ